MTSTEFVTWLDGFLAATGDNLSPDQVGQIKAKAAEVKAEKAVAPQYPSISPHYVPLVYVGGRVPQWWENPITCDSTFPMNINIDGNPVTIPR